MTYTEVLAAASELTSEERVRLAYELTSSRVESDAQLLHRLMPPGSTFEVWSPFEAAEAAHVLRQLLDEAREMK